MSLQLHEAEARWPVILSIAIGAVLLTILPERVRMFPFWVSLAIAAAVIAPMVIVSTRREGASRWLRIERSIVLIFFLFMLSGVLLTLWSLIRAMLEGAGSHLGLRLLSSSVALWVVNMQIFALLYWQLDRGGPGGRDSGEGKRPDWLFPQYGAPSELVAPGWRPKFVDYLSLGYSTATSFSATEVAPLTARAKLLMMMESSISMTTVVIVGARAVGILGGGG